MNQQRGKRLTLIPLEAKRSVGSQDLKIYQSSVWTGVFSLSSRWVVEWHLASWEAREPDFVAKIRKSFHVDDLFSGKTTVAAAKELKVGAIRIFKDAKFTLHKRLLNVSELESEQTSLETKNTKECQATT